MIPRHLDLSYSAMRRFEPIQVVYHDTMENFAEISKCNVGTALIVKGTLVATPQAVAIRDSGSDCYS